MKKGSLQMSREVGIVEKIHSRQTKINPTPFETYYRQSHYTNKTLIYFRKTYQILILQSYIETVSFQFRRTLLALLVMILVIAPQPVLAQEFCGFLDKIVAAGEESPIFDSVRFTNAPNTRRCEVADFDQHQDMGAIRASRRQQDSWLCIWDDLALKEALANEERAAELYFDMDVDNPQHDQAEAYYDQAISRVFQNSNNLRSQARELVSAIQQCTAEGAIRGSWGSFTDDVNYYRSDKRFRAGSWVTCQKSEMRLCIEVRAVTSRHYLTLEVYQITQ